MLRIRGLWALLILLALPQGGMAQQVWSIQTNRGWIGISFNYESAVLPGGSEQTVAVIEGVVEGSPAEASGIHVGDTITHLDGRPISEEVMSSLNRSLEVGDLVRMTILDGDRSREVLVEAGRQLPRNWVLTPNADEMVVRLDSVRGAILQNLDSLRLTIAGVNLMGVDSAGNISIRIVEAPPTRAEVEKYFDLTYRIQEPFAQIPLRMEEFLIPDSSRWEAGIFFSPSDEALPFGAFVVSSTQTAPFREELKRIRRELTEVRREELARMRELQASVQGPVEELARQDDRLNELKTRELALLEEQRKASHELQRVSEESLLREFSEQQHRHEEALAEAIRAQESMTSSQRRAEAAANEERSRVLFREYESRRPTRHIVLGQNFVAGAQLTPLNPDLAEYFRVDEGVLVMEVLDGTPAQEAGMLAGDVIIKVGTERVASLDDLRFGIGYLERPLRLEIIRKGEPIVVTIRR